MTLGTEEFRAGEGFFHERSIHSAGDAFLRIEVDTQDWLTDSDVPTSSEKFDFRQFGHDRMLTGDRMNCCSK